MRVAGWCGGEFAHRARLPIRGELRLAFKASTCHKTQMVLMQLTQK